MKKLERKKKYKDTAPEKTVKFIKGLLEHYGIEIEERYHHIDTADIHSCRIEIANEGIAELGIGTNGKGMNREYTRASAYGEFMERLANNYLIPGDDTNNDGIIYLRKEAAAPLIKAICREVFGSNEEVSDYYINEYYCEEIMFLAFDDVMSNKKVYLPVSLVGNLTGSNGMCAGNSREEAVIQGISEIFERQVHFDLIFNKITPPEIPREYFVGTDICKKLEVLEQAGYPSRILDLSLGKGFPVVGLILYHNGKYRVRLGSDPSPITALERCFTEIFQGFDRIDDNLFVSIEQQEAERKSFQGSDTDFWYKHFNMGITNGNCWFPFNTVTKGIAPDYEFNGFEHPVSISNEDDLNYYFDIIRRNNKKLYISDRSSLGFPVYYTFIPTYSENMIIDDDGRFFVEKSRCSIEKSKLKRVHSLSRNELLSLADDLVKWFDVYSSANNFANSIFRYCSFEPFHKYKVIAYLYACGGNRTKAMEYLDRYFETPAGKTDRQLFVRRNVEEGDIHKCFPTDAWPQCPDCDRCGIKEHCHLDRIKELNSHIREAAGKAQKFITQLKEANGYTGEPLLHRSLEMMCFLTFPKSERSTPMKSKEELNALKEEAKSLNKKLAELTEEDLAQVSGGTPEAFDQAQAEILRLISEALANKWTREHFQAEAESVLLNTPGLDNIEMQRLSQLIIILLSQLPV